MTLRDFFKTCFFFQHIFNSTMFQGIHSVSPQLQRVSTYAMQVPLIDGGAEVKSYQLYRDAGNPQHFFLLQMMMMMMMMVMMVMMMMMVMVGDGDDDDDDDGR